MRQSLFSQLILGILLLLFVCFSAWAQVSPSAGQNYVVEQTPRTAQTSVSLNSSYVDVPATVSYLDGLGRPTQTVQVRGAGDASTDIVTSSTSYDAYGRPNQSFLPVPGGVGGTFLSSPQSSGASFYGDTNPYSETIYEASPLNRPTQQWGPGQNWRTANRKQQLSYGVPGDGATSSGIIRFKVNFFSNVIYGNIEGGSGWDYFGPFDIASRTTTDEQNNQTIEYTDLQGRMIRRDVVLPSQTLTTVYVYDSYERLAAVIPPKLYDWFVANGSAAALYFYTNGDSNTPNLQFIDNCYVYQYDARGRVIRKHIPSAGWTDLVYDQLDRLVMSQDQQDKAEGKWRFTRYDGLNRVVATGRMPLSRAADDLRADFTGVSNETFPSTVNPFGTDLLTESFYDNYTGSPLTFSIIFSSGAPSPWPNATQPNATGLLTRSGVRNLETGAWYSSAFWYDDKARVIQHQSQNHLGFIEHTDTHYQFNGEVLISRFTDEETISSDRYFAYDHLSRPISVSFTPADEPFEMARYSYDAIGRLGQKLIQPTGSGTVTGGNNSITRTANPPTGTTLDQAPDFVEILPDNFDLNYQSNANGLYEAKIGPATGSTTTPALQTLDYRYHIRGWLRGVNVDAMGQPVLNISRGDVFAFGLDYETAGFYDGNIGKQRWLGSRQPSQTRQYTYAYDTASRLSGATYTGASGENYSLFNMSYDQNGNIQTLNRAGIDQLTYSYGEGNKLLSVSDATSNTAGFADGNTSGNDYEYWPDGSLKKDLNRGITDIQYNLLKLPKQISFSTGKVVSYTYTATGQKLRMSSSTGQIRDYLAESENLNGQFDCLYTPEGRAFSGGYEYYHKDHLGNIRAVYWDSLGVLKVNQWRDYDPWGLELSELSSGNSTNRLKFNGKESLAEVGGGVLDYGARLYDATIGRWGVVDPLAEVNRRFSPFVYGNNNPVRMIDPDGREAKDQTNQGFEYSDGYSKQNSRNTTGSVSFEGAYQNGEGSGGEEPIKGGGFPKGEIRSTAEQNAVIRPADGLRQTEVDKAAQLGVDIAWTVEGGATLLKLTKWFKSLVSFSKAVVEGSEDILKLFSGTEKAWQSGATPNSVYTYLSSDGKAVSNYIYNAEGKVIYQVDFGKHGKYLSGHGHEMTIPGNLGSGHQGHIPYNLVPSQYLQVPKGVSYSTPIGH
ncbi:DUF6443 domain-containing protein [Spirosoma foliorum]|uniref:RHS repeat-associated core domain-containing protein n=1 Tax=Spirosoma foliorum TaxID=2710596 RepID=A0A7G5GVG1_9BACT|nr:DUF6443 domain-containing protein [Spirosoma foliorum]QMW02853.1 RHS repeat-associated core domain-containing protein [Spirosoma foliorum]